jgi:hypothetical protein
MRKIYLTACAAALMLCAQAQTQRVILYEEFTGENCPPCASTNPTVDAAINPDFPGKIILLRYQTNIPSAPGAGSLYQDNSSESNTRKTYYNVPFAPYARFNGIVLQDNGGTNHGHAVFIDNSYYPNIINDSAIVNAPFAVQTSFSFNATGDSITVSSLITAAMAYTSSTLKLQVAMSEAEIHFTSPPGTNGEKDFYHVMRKMVPNASGTTLQSSWTNGATQLITLKAAVPAYIKDKSQLEIISWVESQGTSSTTRRVHNATHSAPLKFTDDASTLSISGLAAITCATTINPVVTITNTGSATLSTCTVSCQLDAQTPVTTTYNGALAPGATATVAIPAMPTTAGSHTLTVSTSMPNGNADLNPNNDTKKTTFNIIGNAVTAPIVEPFTSTTFPPPNWTKIDLDGDNIGWSRVAATGSSSGGGTARMYFYNSPAGAIDELYLPYNNLGSSSQLTFYVAGAPYTASSPENDKLEFMVSTNCGQSWSTLYSKSGTTLYTAGGTTSSFSPSSSAQWRMETVSLASYNNMTDLLMKFRATSDYGNNVFVDDVNLSTVTGIAGQPGNVLFSGVYPNPAQDVATLTVTLARAEKVKIMLYNALGASVWSTSKDMVPGDNQASLETAGLPNGIYHVVISTAEGSVVNRLTVSK